jgi:hypothetical protein
VGWVPVLNIDHTFCIGIAKVRVVRRPIVDHGFIYGIGGLIGEDAGRKTGYDFADFKFPRAFQDIIIHEEVVTEERCRLFHVLKESTDTSSEMEHMGWLILGKDGLGVLLRATKGFIGRSVQMEHSLYVRSPSLERRKTHSSFGSLPN